MKLELKHLAAYLPYGVKCQWVRQDDKEVIESTITISDYDFLIRRNNAKPILLPLSDLTKEIEHNGKKFVPNYDSDFKYFITYELDDFIESIPHSLNYDQMQKLLEWHFDIFGLLENGLAIDINTLTTKS